MCIKLGYASHCCRKITRNFIFQIGSSLSEARFRNRYAGTLSDVAAVARVSFEEEK
jgi:hypothetical protein